MIPFLHPLRLCVLARKALCFILFVRIVTVFLLLSRLLCAAEQPIEVKVSIEKNHPGAVFDPRVAFGAGIDGHDEGDSLRMLSPESVKQMLRAGLGPISSRLRTELAVEAWHWNPKGLWSDPNHTQGYWSSETIPDPKAPILVSYGYKLPRRGNTLDEANDDGYSRLDDGDSKTFWKSNPYLTSAYTGDPDCHHPQWVVLDFGKPVPMNAINIQWAEPYATRFRVEYANSGRVYFGGHPGTLLSPVWHPFPQGVVGAGKGGDQFLKLSDHPVKARYLRIWMTECSGTALPGSTDPRDHLGYAIREISAGEAGSFDFDDHVIHSPDKKQTITYASSTDPWHRAIDRDPKVEQPGIDLLFRCGITRGLPLMLAVPVFYDTPEDATGLTAYVRRQAYPVSRYEMGEEPDGQRIDPKDFGSLYAQVAKGISQVAPEAIMGGPSFVTVDVDRRDDQTYRFDKRWWIRDFLGELKRCGQSGNFRFLSFEWYPFDDVDGNESQQLPRAFGMLHRAMALLRSPGMPRVPLVIGELNYSVFPCRQEVDLAGGLLNAETMAQFFSEGGDGVYYYGYEPNKLDGSSGSWGNQLMLLDQKAGEVPVATFQTLRMLSQQWMDPCGGLHQVFPCHLTRSGKRGDLLSAFVLKRPDGKWSLLLLNKDATHAAQLSFIGLDWEPHTFTTYSSAEYIWHPDGPNGHPSPNLAPSTRRVSENQRILIPPWSLTVIK